MIKIRITDLYQLLRTTTKQEWKEYANTFFQERILRLEKTPEELEAQRNAEDEAAWEATLAFLLEDVDEKKLVELIEMVNNKATCNEC